MAGFFTDPEIPKYIYVCGLIGLICLTIALISFIVFFTVYHEKYDTSVKQFDGGTTEQNALVITTTVFTSLGIFFCFFILAGHIIKQKKDPQVVFGPRSYIEFPDTGEFVEMEKESSDIYTGKSKDILSINRKLNTDFL